MTIADWRSIPASAAAAMYAREAAQWQRALGWDTTGSWATVEAARTGWGLPGYVCTAASGEIRGWTFYLPRAGGLDIGGISAADPPITRALVDRVLDDVPDGGTLNGFVYGHAPGLAVALADSGIGSTPYAYLVRAAAEAAAPDRTAASMKAPAGTQVCEWSRAMLDEATALVARAYGTAGWLFARDNTPGAWRGYVAALVDQTGCGRFAPPLSRVARVDGAVRGLALVTIIGPATAHLAQLAVDPDARRLGLARHLVTSCLEAAERAGYPAMSLLVAADNAAARGLYAQAGFRERASFLAIGPPAAARRGSADVWVESEAPVSRAG